MNRKGLFVGSVIALLAAGGGVYAHFTSAQESKDAARIAADLADARQADAVRRQAESDLRATALLQEWENYPIPERKPTFGKRPKLPPLPPVDAGHDPSLRLQYILLNSSVKSIRDDFEPRLRRGEIIMSDQVPSGAAAAFGTLLGSEFTSITRAVEPDKLYPSFGINLPTLVSMETEEDVLFMMMAVVHEHRHYEQWRDGDEETREFFHLQPIAKQQPVNHCMNAWRLEEEAYRVTCDSAIAWGFDMFDGECSGVLDTAFFHQRLFWHLVGSGQATADPECLVSWATAAGHPHPEAFTKGFLLQNVE